MDIATLIETARNAADQEIVIWADDAAIDDASIVAEVEAALPKGLHLAANEDGDLVAVA
jgi:hypothetical protein